MRVTLGGRTALRSGESYIQMHVNTKCATFPKTSLHKKVPLNRCPERGTAVVMQVAERYEYIMFVGKRYYESSDNWLGQIELMAKFEPAMNEHV